MEPHQTVTQAQVMRWAMHELRSPLSSLSGYCGLMLDYPDKIPNLDEFADLLLSIIERLDQAIDHVVDAENHRNDT
jgi:signal transduction histidine kinase